MLATLIPLGLILGFIAYLFYCWWAEHTAPGAPRSNADEVHFNPHLYTHAKQFCEHNTQHTKSANDAT